MIGALYDYFLKKRSRHVTVVVGTSGDTGSAAIYAVKDLKNVDIIVLYPKGRISKVQEQQMISHPEENVHVYAVEGTSDDLDVPCRKVLSDVPFRTEHKLASINSPNVGRIIMQIIHFFYAYLYATRKKSWKNVVIAIPTGACGNLTSGYMAYLMGLPISLVATVNENDIVSEWINTGIFTLKGKSEVIATISPAMDILVPYNWERILYYISGGNSQAVSKCVQDFDTKQHSQMPHEWHALMRKTISAASISQKSVRNTIKLFYETQKYILDPHTAIAVSAVWPLVKSNDKTCYVCLSTASPAKFGETIQSTINILPQTSNFKGSYFKEMKRGEDWEKILRDVILKITSIRLGTRISKL